MIIDSLRTVRLNSRSKIFVGEQFKQQNNKNWNRPRCWALAQNPKP